MLKKQLTQLTVIIFFIITIYEFSYSYPKFAAYTGENCVSCHVNPTGGGIRNKYGINYSKENLVLKSLKKLNKTTEFNTQLTKGIQIGADMRTIFINQQTGEGQPNFNSFFQMQGDLYINATINKYLTLVIAPGLYIPNTFGSSPLPTKYEIYGMVNNLPHGLYFKFGRFIQNYGLKIPEHRAYQRDYNGFYTPYAADAGFEVGISPWLFNLTAGVSNGSTKNIDGQLNNSFDFDNQKQFTSSLDFRWSSKNSNYNFGVGGSFLSNPYKYDLTNNINAVRQATGGFFSIGLFDRVAILGEYDYNKTTYNDSAGTISDFNTIFGEVNVKIIKGLEAKFQYESYDPQLDIKNGSLERRRYSFGIEFFPMTGLEIESIYRIVDEPDQNLDIKNNEFQQTFKVYF
jgi:hypothetical protein